MRITEFDLQIEDLEWYAIDENNNIAFFTSGGMGNVPEFICKSREYLNIVSNYFDLSDNTFAEAEVVEGAFDDYPNDEFKKDCIDVSEKGLFCYDVSDEDEHKNEYKLLCRPNNMLKLGDLPEEIQEIIKQYKLDGVSFVDKEYVKVINA